MSNARFSILQGRAVSDKRISDQQFRVLAALGRYTDDEGWCFPKQNTLAEDLGKSRQTVNGHIQALKELGYLEVHHQFRDDGSQRANKYRLVFDLPPLEEGGGVKKTRQGVTVADLTGGDGPGLDTNNDPIERPNRTGDDETSPKTRQQMLLEERERQSKEPPPAKTIEQAIFSDQPVTEDLLRRDTFEDDVRDAAYIICQNNQHLIPLAEAFMLERKIVLSVTKSKQTGHRKALKEMYDAKPNQVKPEHVRAAVKDLVASVGANRVTDLYSVVKTAIAIANPLQADVPCSSKFPFSEPFMQKGDRMYRHWSERYGQELVDEYLACRDAKGAR